MTAIYILDHGASINLQQDNLLVRRPEQPDRKVRLRDVQRVAMGPHVQVTTEALAALLRQRICISMHSSTGALIGRAVPPLMRQADLRQAQYRKFADPHAALAAARTTVSAKIINQIACLRRYAHNHPDAITAMRAGAIRLEHHRANAANAASPEALRGFEGAAGRAYWQLFALQIAPAGINFAGRRYRPAPDPVNAALSFAYTLLTNAVSGQIEAAGLDPYLGFFHTTRPGRASLALDIVEQFRPVIADRLVLRLFRTRVLDKAGFEHSDDGGVRFGSAARKAFLKAWEQAIRQEQLYDEIDALLSGLRKWLHDAQPQFPAYDWKGRT